ncbi:MAG: DUF2249 domain-containing protein [Sulfuricurvum sp.]|jgi:uncharacterized protein (DUF2249 family)
MQTIQLDGATVPFYVNESEGTRVYSFDTSMCGHPEPMINAMTGLAHLKEGEKLIMINSKVPMGLFPKIEEDFSYEVAELANGTFEILFMKKGNGTNTNFGDNGCSGGCSH